MDSLMRLVQLLMSREVMEIMQGVLVMVMAEQ
jgi:hypothetical protein